MAPLRQHADRMNWNRGSGRIRGTVTSICRLNSDLPCRLMTRPGLRTAMARTHEVPLQIHAVIEATEWRTGTSGLRSGTEWPVAQERHEWLPEWRLEGWGLQSPRNLVYRLVVLIPPFHQGWSCPVVLAYRMETKRRGLRVPLAPGWRPDMSLRFRPFPLPTIGYWNRSDSPDLKEQRRWSPVVDSMDRQIGGRQVVIGGRRRL